MKKILSILFILAFTGTTQAQEQPSITPATTTDPNLVTLYGYLTIYPEDLGFFMVYPENLINIINQNITEGYDDWRLPTKEELQVMQANKRKISNFSGKRYARKGVIMSKGGYNIRLVTTGKLAAVKKAEAEEQRRIDSVKVSEQKRIDSVKVSEQKRNGVIINGVRWATCNVDIPGTFAAKPEDAGMFYQWNRNIGWSVTKPIINSNGGTTWDSSKPAGTIWSKSNDPSPEGWRVPTLEESKKLFDKKYVSRERITVNGVTGMRFTDKFSGNSIFLPAVGYRHYSDGTLYHAGEYGHYWSSTQDDSNYAYYLYFGSGYADWRSLYRSFGFSVRSVADQ